MTLEGDLEREVDRLLREPAIDQLEAALAALPSALSDTGPAKALRAEVLRRRGDATGATVLYAEAIADCPHLHSAYHGAALTRIACGDPAAARAVWTALLDRAPDDPIARYQIGLTWHDERNYAEAAHWYEAQLARHPASFPAAQNLGLARLAGGNARGAAAAFLRATEIDARHAGAWTSLGEALRRDGNWAGAAQAWLRAHALEPANVHPLASAAEALGEAAELPAAIGVLTRAIAQDSGNAQLRWAAGAHLSSLGLHRDAVRVLREALEIDPADWRGHSALLLELQYDTALASREELAAAHRKWAEIHTSHVVAARPPVHSIRRAGDTRLRVGYLSPRFGHGPLASLFLPVLEAHDRRRFHITLYSAYPHADDVATRMRAASDAWSILPLDDDAAAAAIVADRLDLLVDLAGHTPGHRLPVLARKPAPVQATWLDYFDTTGMPEIDYLLTDATHTPASDAQHFHERIVWLPHCRFVYAPLARPAPSGAPSGARGFVTFGSFNRHAKITADVLAIWKSVLEAVPNSRLELRASAYRGPGTVAWLTESWSRAGMPVDRIDFRPYVPLAEALRAYQAIDIALDTFPYNGGVTTCDALACGVPVITLAGERMIARQGAALLRAALHPEWIATTPANYVRLAAEVARDPARAEHRIDLARALSRSPLCGVPEFVAALERAYCTMIELGPLNREGGTQPPLEIGD